MSVEPSIHKIGIISDTHGVLRDSVKEAFEDVDQIIHAGDVGSDDVIQQLERIAPTTVVRGNHDTGPWADAWPITEIVVVNELILYVIHNLNELDLDPWTADCRAVISGHTHCAQSQLDNGVLFLNPGCAGLAQRDLPNSVAILEVTGATLKPRIIELVRCDS